MKRSEVNSAISQAVNIFTEHKVELPEFAFLSPEQWISEDPKIQNETISGALGWDITDFGREDFCRFGLTLFTIRNRTKSNPRPYAEKIMLAKRGQITPMHYHWNKMEDIINRGGGTLIVELYNRDPDTDLLDKEQLVRVYVDNKIEELKPGKKLKLKPGQSISITPNLYHQFYPDELSDYVLIGEVSSANDDVNDNRFLEDVGRFPEILEDVPPSFLLSSDYSKYLERKND